MVTGTATGTVQDTGKQQVEPKDSVVAGTGLGGKEGGAETKPERTYKQSEVDALLGKAGTRIQAKLDAVTNERNTFKSQLDSLTAEIAEAKDSMETLTKDIEAMTRDDPDKQFMVKLRKEKEAELKAAKAERAKIAEEAKEVVQWKRDQLVYTVASEFVTSSDTEVDMDTFKKAADKLKLGDREGLEILAETLGYKSKSETEEEPPKRVVPGVKPYSGKTDGGGGGFTREQITKMPMEEYAKLRPQIEQAYMEGKIK